MSSYISLTKVIIDPTAFDAVSSVLLTRSTGKLPKYFILNEELSEKGIVSSLSQSIFIGTPHSSESSETKKQNKIKVKRPCEIIFF